MPPSASSLVNSPIGRVIRDIVVQVVDANRPEIVEQVNERLNIPGIDEELEGRLYSAIVDVVLDAAIGVIGGTPAPRPAPTPPNPA